MSQPSSDASRTASAKSMDSTTSRASSSSTVQVITERRMMAVIYGHMDVFDESGEQWATYIERFVHYVVANDIPEAKKVSILFSVMGPKTYGLLCSLVAPVAPGTKTYKQVVIVLKDHFTPKPLIIAKRFRFHKRNQGEGETVAQYVAVLKKLSEHCEFRAYLEDALRDRFVCRLKCEAVQKRLLTEDKLTFKKAVEHAVSAETAACDVQQLSNSLKVNAVFSQVEAELKRLTELGVISPVAQSDWATPVVPVNKDGTVRLCGDFKVTLNPALCIDKYPIPRIEDLFASLAGGKHFSKLDLSNAYLQMEVEESSKKLLTISTQKGLFCFNCLPFGVASSPALFQKAMDQVLLGLPHTHCYLDDILVSGPDKQTHLKTLNAVLSRLEEYGLHLKQEKCLFFQESVEYLGHIIDAAGLHKSPEKVCAIIDAPAPGDVSQLRSFLGMLNYYGRFIPDLATVLKPLNELLNKEKMAVDVSMCISVPESQSTPGGTRGAHTLQP
ncbi:hypothetical protein SRHO_G00289950 [Serrasalmus rhombeus]